MKACHLLTAAKTNLNIEDEDHDTLLLFCLNNVLNEVASEFIPVYHEEKLSVLNNKADITQLTKIPIKITSVMCDKGSIPFVETPFELKLKHFGSGEVIVTYSYLPVVADPEDELPYRENLIRALSFGLAAEYCLVNGPDSEAELWDIRYKDAIKEALFDGKERHIKQRAWY